MLYGVGEASGQFGANEMQGGIRFVRCSADLVVPVEVTWQPHTPVFGLGDVLEDGVHELIQV